jgi:putative peptidoglycan lipid II flippase
LVVSGVALLAAVRRARGRAALHGTVRAAAAGLAGAVAGAAAGVGLSAAVPATGFFPNAAVALLACCGAVITFGVTAYVVDGGDLRAVVGRAKHKVVP